MPDDHTDTTHRGGSSRYREVSRCSTQTRQSLVYVHARETGEQADIAKVLKLHSSAPRIVPEPDGTDDVLMYGDGKVKHGYLDVAAFRRSDTL